jgi:hypothetical protein
MMPITTTFREHLTKVLRSPGFKSQILKAIPNYKQMTGRLKISANDV